MQDYFCPKCGRRMIDGKCSCSKKTDRHGTRQREHAGNAGKSAPARKARAAEGTLGPALTEEKIIPFDNIRNSANAPSAPGASGASPRKKEVMITLVEAEELEKRQQKKAPWKAEGLSPVKRVSMMISHGVSRLTAFIDELVNPEDE